MSESETGSPLGGEPEEAFELEQEESLTDNETNLEVHESKEEVLRRKKIRRQLEQRLERKRLREELDDFIDLDEGAGGEPLDDDEN